MSNAANPFVKYLNGLHDYNAQNANAYGEKNVESVFYPKTMVEMEIFQHLVTALSDRGPHVLVLTGHAGDGKTSLMYQVLTRFGITLDVKAQTVDVVLPNGKECLCIKDFSELSEEKKMGIMRDAVNRPFAGKYVFMVANTGPLINTFGQLFDDSIVSERAKMQLIEAMEGNKGEIRLIENIPFLVVNIASIDNTGFPSKYISKVVTDELWLGCADCPKRAFCHICLNRKLIRDNLSRVCDFITKYYVWETEYGHRLTIRSMTEQLAYMITGGVECESVAPVDFHKMLFSNLFFGYVGTIPNPQAMSVLAVKLARENHFASRRLRADEDLIIRRSYKKLFSEEVADILYKGENGSMFLKGWAEELRRSYFFLNIVPEDVWRRDTEDIFSKQFVQYLDVRCGDNKPSKSLKTLIIDALRMMYLGTIVSNSNTIPITMCKESGIAQSVQLVVGELNVNDIEVITKPDSLLNKGKNNLFIRLRKQEEVLISLPMLNYFEEVRNGVISTNIDPQLSHGIESLKAQLLRVVSTANDDLEMIILNNSGYEKMSISIENKAIRLN